MINNTQLNLDDARSFLNALDDNDALTFQTFDESEKKRVNLNRIVHGSLNQHAEILSKLNKDGAGVFVMVNEGNLKGRTKDCVKRVRAVFVDLDNAPFEPLKNAALAPNITIESSPGRYHGYWLIEDCELNVFTQIQLALAERFGGDPSVKDLPRVMRIPGFIHQKAEPYLSRIIALNKSSRYTLDELIGSLQLNLVKSGNRNNSLASHAGYLRAGGMEREEINDHLQEANSISCVPSLPVGEVAAIAKSISRYSPNHTGKNQRFDWPAFLLPAGDILSKEEFIFMRLDEHGLYQKLLCYCWINDTAPRDPAKLALVLRSPEEEVRQALTDQVLALFQDESEGRIYSPYLREEREHEAKSRRGKSEGGRMGGLVTQAKNRKAKREAQL